jgi:hypothetical protein
VEEHKSKIANINVDVDEDKKEAQIYGSHNLSMKEEDLAQGFVECVSQVLNVRQNI